MRRVDSKRGNSSEKFEDMVARTFERTMKEFLELEKKYDIETEHRLNWRCQEKWDKHIKEKLEFYVKIYDRKKARFCKLAESPTKGR